MLTRASMPLLAAATLLTLPVCAQNTLSAVQVWSQNGVTRVAITLKAETHYLSDRLSNPDRIFFDFPGVEPRIKGSRAATISVDDPLLRQIRVGETKPGVARVVLDLKNSAEVSVETIPNPVRFLIELRKPGTQLTAPERPISAVPPPVRAEAAAARPAPRRYTPGPMAILPAGGYISVLPPPLLLASTRPGLSVPAVEFPPPPSPARVRNAKAATAPPVSPAPVPRERAARLTPSPAPPATGPAQSGLPATAPSASLTRALGLKIRRIVLDPGHGGHDQGTAGSGGLTEKELVLDIAHRLSKLLVAGLQAEVILTRTEDRFISLEQRTRIANESKADLFLSIHANSSPVKTVSGVETYFLSFTTSKAAMETAARENASSERSVYELRDLLQQIALKEKVDESREFAEKVNAALYRGWYNRSAYVRNRGIKKAPFVVLIGANMPSILAEVGFLSNPRDERELKKSETRQRIAESLYKGISQYADTLSHFQVASRTAASDQEEK